MREHGKRVAKVPPRRNARHQGKRTGKQKFLIVATVLVAIVLGLALLYHALFVRPEVGELDRDETLTENLDYGDGVQPKSSGARKTDDWYTILLLGRDTGGGGNCDTMMLASYNVTDQKVTVLNIPRDTMVNVPWDVKKINSVYNVNGQGKKGIRALYKEISQLVGFAPDFEVIVEWEAVGKLVDAIGGVWFDVPRSMDYEDPLQNLSIHIPKGYQRLNGKQAMGVVRFRDGRNGYKNGDIGRIETQQNFLKAVMEQLLNIQNVTKIKELAQVFQENVDTDLTYQNLFWFGKSAVMGGLDMENVNFITMPFENTSAYSRSYHARLSYVTPKAEELLDLVNTELSPFVEQFELSDLDIMSVNADGSLSSSAGHVEDTKAARIPPQSSKRPGQSSESPVVDPDGNLLPSGNGKPPKNPETSEHQKEPEVPSVKPSTPPETKPTVPPAVEPEVPPVTPPDVKPETPPTPPAPPEGGTPSGPDFSVIDPVPAA